MMGKRARLWFGLAIWLAVGLPAWGQSAAPPLASTFDVASIRPSKPSDAPESIRPFLHGSFSATNATVHDLMNYAYFPVHTYNIVGGPGWTRSDRYDIEAKVVKPDDRVTPPEVFQARLQALLADRFKLAVHRETRELPIYWLVVAKGGPKLPETKDGSCVVPDLKAPLPKPGPGERPPCDYLRASRNRISGAGVEVAKVAEALKFILSRDVVDKTGLTARYDVYLEWAPDGALNPAPPTAPDLAPPPDANGPSLFTALEEQLGLKLESRKGATEVIVIDHVERPDEN